MKKVYVETPLITIEFQLNCSLEFNECFLNIYHDIIINTLDNQNIVVVGIEEVEGNFIITYQGKEWRPSKYYILVSLHVLICDIISEFSNKYESINFHGSAVNYNDKTILILGHKGQGKTTFMFELLKNGAMYIADEAVVCNGESIKPFMNCLHVGEYTYQDFSQKKQNDSINIPDKYLPNDKKYFNVSKVTSNYTNKCHKLDVVIILDDTYQDIMNPSNKQAMIEIIKHCRNIGGTCMKVLLKIVNTTQIYTCNKYQLKDLSNLL